MGTYLYAEIVVNLLSRKLDRVFHYSIPDHMQEEIKEGMQVLVPFGPQVVDGYVIGFADTAEVEKTRDILEIVHEEPVFDKQMLELARWLAENYLCSVVDAINVLVPVGLKLHTDKTVSLNSEATKVILETDKYHDICEFILEKKNKADLRLLQKTFGKKPTDDFIKFLKKIGFGEVTVVFNQGARPKVVKRALLREHIIDEVDSYIKGMEKTAPKQAGALRVIAGEGPVDLPELKAMGFGLAIINQLKSKGIIEIEQVETFRDPFVNDCPVDNRPAQLTTHQSKVLREIEASIGADADEVFLLHGVTGSGKTEVYLRAIDKALTQGKQAIVLVPEISLTPQMVGRFRGRFGSRVAVLHSGLSVAERYDQWRQIKAGVVQVAVGARSAIFAPFAKLGLIILDEEHENTYKQEDNPKYHAREVAIFRAKQHRCPVILGSATPAVESYWRASQGAYRLLELPERVAKRPLPTVDIVDLREEMEAGNRSIFSRLLAKRIEDTLTKKEQVILFLNRRGYSTFVVCRDCGFVVRCNNCHVSMTYHAAPELMLCHYCGSKIPAPKICPQCGSKHIRYFGLGTQKVEQEIQKHFPGARILRMDVDTTGKKGAHQRILDSFASGEADILVGTQMIAKGLDFPNVTLVGVITADTSLNLPDFRSAERTFQLLTQVAGRAGRGEMTGSVVIQTYTPEHYSIQYAKLHDYIGFYRLETEMRNEMEYPPFCQLLRIVISGFDENRVVQASHLLAESFIKELRSVDVEVDQPMLGPAPAPLSKVKNRFRWQLCLKAKDRHLFSDLVEQILYDSGIREQFQELKFSLEVDPLNLL